MIDPGLARVSNDLLVVAVLSYGTAMIGYAAEFAFAGRGAPARRRPVAHAAADLSAIDAPTDLSGIVVPDVPSWMRPGGPAGPRAPQELPAPSARSQRAGRIALILTLIGWVAHVGMMVTRGFAAGRTPWGNMYEFSCMITLVAVTGYLITVARRPELRCLGAFVMLPVVVTLGLAGTVLYSKAEPLQPALQSYWLKIHVTAAILAWGTFMVGFIQTALYLTKARYEAKVAAGAVIKGGGIMRRVPDAKTLDTAAYRTIAFGFPIWTFAIIAGAVWAEAAWGRYWGWDPKETWSFITWVIYAGYLHARATAGWKGRKAAWIAVAAFTALTFDYYVINIFLNGLHSYAGL